MKLADRKFNNRATKSDVYFQKQKRWNVSEISAAGRHKVMTRFHRHSQLEEKVQSPEKTGFFLPSGATLAQLDGLLELICGLNVNRNVNPPGWQTQPFGLLI